MNFEELTEQNEKEEKNPFKRFLKIVFKSYFEYRKKDQKDYIFAVVHQLLQTITQLIFLFGLTSLIGINFVNTLLFILVMEFLLNLFVTKKTIKKISKRFKKNNQKKTK